MALIINWIEQLRELTFVSMVLRLTLSLCFGGFIGMERERKHRPAGFRTYMLVCLGAALAMILSQYEALLLVPWGLATDISRFGAQVVNGIGFLAAGTIIITGRQEVKGLTTAAALWSSASMGLAIGAGFLECAFVGWIIIFICVRFLQKMEQHLLSRERSLLIYVELRQFSDVGRLLQYIRSMGIHVSDVDMSRGDDNAVARPSVVLTLHLNKPRNHSDVLTELSRLDSVHLIEEVI